VCATAFNFASAPLVGVIAECWSWNRVKSVFRPTGEIPCTVHQGEICRRRAHHRFTLARQVWPWSMTAVVIGAIILQNNVVKFAVLDSHGEVTRRIDAC